MDHLFGQVELQVCGLNEQGSQICCDTGILDNPGRDDFEDGSVNSFTDGALGGCFRFDLTKATTGDVIKMRLTHHGFFDDARFDWVKVFNGQGTYECFFSEVLEDFEIEVGHDCTFSSQ